MRLAAATRAGAPGTGTEPDAVRAGGPGRVAAGAAGRTSSTGRPSRWKPAPRGNERLRPCRSSSSTTTPSGIFSTRVTAPQNPVWTSSTTRPLSAATCGSARRVAGAAPLASGSWSYLEFRTGEP